MEAKHGDDYSISVPLLFDSKSLKENHEHKLNDSIYHDRHSTGGTTTFFQTCFHTINSLAGVGMLSVPYALSSGGWLSLIFLFAIALASSYTGLLMKRCMDSSPNTRTYPDVGELAFGRKGRLVATILLHLEIYLTATSFLILEGDNLQNLFPVGGLEIAGTSIDGKQMFTVIVALIILPTVLLKDLSVLSYISASGVLASVVVLVSIFCVGAFDGVGFNEKVAPVKWSGIPKAVSLYAFCYSVHPVFPTLYTSMPNKEQFPKVLILSFLFSTIVYATMAVVGCLMFGLEAQSQITLNLPTEMIFSKVAIYTTLVNPMVKYALAVTPTVHHIENLFQPSTQTSLLVRITMVISTLLVALVFPSFGGLTSLIGAFLSVTACLTLPCLCYLKISCIYRRLGLELVTILVILSMSVFIAVVGTYTSILEIIQQL